MRNCIHSHKVGPKHWCKLFPGDELCTEESGVLCVNKKGAKMKARLVTICGCEKVIDVPPKMHEIIIPLKQGLEVVGQRRFVLQEKGLQTEYIYLEQM
jgi:hypothetical protein